MKLNNLGRLESLIYLGDEDYNDFDSVEEENRLHERPDLCAFLLLDKICPNPGLNFFLLSSTMEEIHFYESLVGEGVPWYIALEPALRGDIVDHPVYGGGCAIPRPLHTFLPSLSNAGSFVLQGVDKGLDPKAAYARIQSVLSLCGGHGLGLTKGVPVYITLSQARSLDVLDIKNPLTRLWVVEPQDSFLRESISLAKAEPVDREYLGGQERLDRNSKFESLYKLTRVQEKPMIQGKQWALSLAHVMGILGQPA